MTKEEAIYNILTESELSKYVGDRIYPLVVPNGVNKYPFVIYTQEVTRTVGTKDGDRRTLNLALSVVSKGYKEAHEIACALQTVFFSDHTTEIEKAVGWDDFRFESESEMFDLASDTYMVKTEVSYEYSF